MRPKLQPPNSNVLVKVAVRGWGGDGDLWHKETQVIGVNTGGGTSAKIYT